MNRFFLTVCIIIATMLVVNAMAEQTMNSPKVELLWPNGAPGAKGTTDNDKPTLTILLPPQDKATGTAIVICPGGGYACVTMDYEGVEVAQWLNSLGIAGFVLNYRHQGTGYGYPAPLLDAQRAVRMVRSRANEWNVDPDRIGILGFSAGGHLAATVGTHFDKGFPDAKDPVDKIGCRPDFMVLIYPVITMTDWFTHAGSRNNLLGQDPNKALLESMSDEKQVTSETPPAFMVHTNEDKAVPAENSIYFYLALRKAKVPAEIHIYEKGPHGFGLGEDIGTTVSSWPGSCAHWMRERGLLDKKKSDDTCSSKTNK